MPQTRCRGSYRTSPDYCLRARLEFGGRPSLLFRFSALTYNARLIRYDRDYAMGVEGYPGLVTHGPLQALAMAEAACRQGVGGDVDYKYRLVATLAEFQRMATLAEPSPDGVETSVRDVSDRTTGQETANPSRRDRTAVNAGPTGCLRHALERGESPHGKRGQSEECHGRSGKS
ncbi:hypothetical protein ABH935_009302 [Catenulispora sp. GAS73]